MFRTHVANDLGHRVKFGMATCTLLPFYHAQKFVSFVGSRSVKNFHCASVVCAEGEATEPRLTLKQIERKKLEKRSECM